jgi:hypothetical protein
MGGHRSIQRYQAAALPCIRPTFYFLQLIVVLLLISPQKNYVRVLTPGNSFSFTRVEFAICGDVGYNSGYDEMDKPIYGPVTWTVTIDRTTH